MKKMTLAAIAVCFATFAFAQDAVEVKAPEAQAPKSFTCSDCGKTVEMKMPRMRGPRGEMKDGKMPRMPRGPRGEAKQGDKPRMPRGPRGEMKDGEMPRMPRGPRGEKKEFKPRCLDCMKAKMPAAPVAPVEAAPAQ